MAYVNFKRGYVRFKIVYYGPELSGKTANLEHLGKLSTDKVEVRNLGTDAESTGYFEHFPLSLGRLRGIETMLKIYTVPGRHEFNKTRLEVLKDVDGVVFVVDSSAGRLGDSTACLRNLKANLAEHDVSLFDLPVVVQYNKRDLTNVLSVDELNENLNPFQWPSIEAVASQGKSVKKTLTRIAQIVYEQAAEEYSLIASVPPVETAQQASTEVVEEPALEPAPDPEPIQDVSAEPEVEPEPAIEAETAIEPESEELSTSGPSVEKASSPDVAPKVKKQPGPAFGDPSAQKLVAETKAEPEPPPNDPLEKKEVSLDLVADKDETDLVELDDEDLKLLSAEENTSVPEGKLSRGVAAQLIKSVPPPPMFLPRPASKKKLPSTPRVPNREAQIVRLISGLEDRLLARLDQLETQARAPETRPSSAASDKALLKTIYEVRDGLTSLTAEVKSIRSAIDSLRKTLEQTAEKQEGAYYAFRGTDTPADLPEPGVDPGAKE